MTAKQIQLLVPRLIKLRAWTRDRVNPRIAEEISRRWPGLKSAERQWLMENL